MCVLCKLVEREGADTRLYYENSVIKICDCNACPGPVPMVVFKRHGEATPRERRLAMAVIKELFEPAIIRTQARKILDHEHWHIEGGVLKR